MGEAETGWNLIWVIRVGLITQNSIEANGLKEMRFTTCLSGKMQSQQKKTASAKIRSVWSGMSKEETNEGKI